MDTFVRIPRGLLDNLGTDFNTLSHVGSQLTAYERDHCSILSILYEKIIFPVKKRNSLETFLHYCGGRRDHCEQENLWL